MTDEEIRIKVAEAMGWTDVRHIGRGDDTICIGKPAIRPGGINVPDYLNDLNAMHEVEETLYDQQYTAFSDHLYDAECQRQKDTKKWRWLSATARQRAEAFLRTIGKWEEAAK